MKLKDIKGYLLSKPKASEDFPFGPEVAVMKVQGKMFATLALNEGIVSMNLKCDPHEALMLREIFQAVRPGYHMNKQHWNTVVLDGSIPRGEIERMVDNSFTLVVRGLPASTRRALEI